MNFENKKGKRLGKSIGYILMYLLFTAVLYFLLSFLHRIPEDWNYFHVILITSSIILLGTLLKMLLK